MERDRACGSTSPDASAAGQKRLPGRAKPIAGVGRAGRPGFSPTISTRMSGPTVSGKHARARRLDVDPLLAVVDELVDREARAFDDVAEALDRPPREVAAREPVVVVLWFGRR